MKKYLLFLSLFFAVCVNAQITFQKTYGGTNYENANSVCQTQDGGYIITGKSAGQGKSYLSLVKTSIDGSLQWSKMYGTSKFSEGFSVQQTNDGGFIAVGQTGYDVPNSYGFYNIYLIKTDSAGNLQWSKTYGGSSPGWGYGVKQEKDGGFIICGICQGICLIKIASDGSVQWSKKYDGGTANGFSETSDGGFIIVGVSSAFKNDNSDNVYLLKVDSNGTLQWTTAYGGPGFHGGNAVLQTNDDGFMIAGETDYAGVEGYLIKTSSNGALQWTKTYGNGYAKLNSISATNDGGYLMCGLIGGTDVYLLKVSSAGALLWSKSFGGTAGEAGFSAQSTSDGGFIIAAITNSFGAGDVDMYLIKTDSNGNSGCYEGNPNTIVGQDGSFAASMGTENNLIIQEDVPLMQIGNSVMENTICKATGIQEDKKEISINIFPNPTTGKFTIESSDPSTPLRVTSVEIINVFGEKVYQKENRQLSIINSSLLIDLSQVPNGIYFVEIICGSERSTKKIILE